LSYLKILSYTLLLLNCRWFTSVVPLTRASEVISSSDSWHLAVPRASRRLLNHSRRSLLSHNSWSLLSYSRRSLLIHSRRRSLLSHNTRRMSTIARATRTTHLTTPHCVTLMTQIQSQSQFEQLQSSAPMVRSPRLCPHSFMVCYSSWVSPRPWSTRSRVFLG
jgi:hypothetical protein